MTEASSHEAPEAGRPIVFRRGTVLTMDHGTTVLRDTDVLVVGERIEAVGPGLARPRTAPFEIDAVRRHRDAGHDRHAPPHVADRDARVRGRLDPHPVLRLVLPGARQELPARGRARGQPAVGDRVPRRRGDDHGRLVARAADDRARRRRRRRAAGGPRPVRPRLRQHPGGAVGVVGAPEFRDFVQPPVHRGDDMLGFQMAFDVTGDPRSPSAPPSRSPASSACPSPRTPASGAPRTTTASGSSTTTGSPHRRRSTCTRRP